MKRAFLLFLISAFFPLSAEEECPPLFNVWSSYTNLYLDDDRSEGSIGVSRGQSVIYALGIFLSPCATGTIYGVYEKAETTNPLNRPTATTTEQGFSDNEGWGLGGTLAYKVYSWFTPYIDYSYVWYRQDETTLIENAFLQSLNHSFDGQRWKLSGGVNVIFPIGCYAFGGSVNYIHIVSWQGGSIDPQDGQVITGVKNHLGIANANATLYLMPERAINPFVNGGISYDAMRSSDPASVINPPLAPQLLIGVPRPAFEWNVGCGVSLTKGGFSFATSYLHRQRVGPITTDSVTVYLAAMF